MRLYVSSSNWDAIRGAEPKNKLSLKAIKILERKKMWQMWNMWPSKPSSVRHCQTSYPQTYNTRLENKKFTPRMRPAAPVMWADRKTSTVKICLESTGKRNLRMDMSPSIKCLNFRIWWGKPESWAMPLINDVYFSLNHDQFGKSTGVVTWNSNTRW